MRLSKHYFSLNLTLALGQEQFELILSSRICSGKYKNLSRISRTDQFDAVWTEMSHKL